MRVLLTYRLLLLVVGFMGVVGFVPSGKVIAGERCFDNWSEAARIIPQEGLMPASKIQALVDKRGAGKVVRITLCQRGADFRYKLVVFDHGGKAHKMELDAKKPVIR